MATIFAKRLRAARLQAGLSQEALGQEVGITKQAISKYEKGKMQPDSKILLALGRVLGHRSDYFFRPFRVSLDRIAFRKRSVLSGRKLEALKGRITDRLERYLEVEELLNRPVDFVNPLAGKRISNGEDVEKTALDLLHTWDLGVNPIPNVLEMLEDVGVKVVAIDAEPEFDGLSAWLENGIPVIVINRQFDLLRTRFTALHELGHLLLSFPAGLSKKEIERYCNRFAGALLLPRPAIFQELGEHRNQLTLNELITVKESYGISMQAVVYRARQLGIIKKSVADKFWKWRNSHPDHRLEKGFGKYRGQERSTRFEQLLYQAVAEEIISYSKGASLANKDLESFKNNLKVVG